MIAKAAADLLDDTGSRYPGTRPFTDSPDDTSRFFGRDEEAEALYLRVLSVPLLVQFARSGLGKTSLLQAGLFPRLRKQTFLPVMIRLNAADDSLTDAVVTFVQESCRRERLEFVPGDTRGGIWEFLSTTTIWRDDLLLTPVLVFDQFEEVFTLRDAAFRANVASELGALASGTPRPEMAQPTVRPEVKLVISVREDYLGAIDEFSVAIPTLFHERLRLEALSEEAARLAITAPARLTARPDQTPYASPRFELDAESLDAMVRYLKGKSGTIEPFQLQLLCRHAEASAQKKSASASEPVPLHLADLGGEEHFQLVLKNFYRDTLAKLDPPSQRRRAAALCEDGLLDASGHRPMLEEGQAIRDYGVSRDTLVTLCKERLLRREPRLERVFYEISHDRLAESIHAARRVKLPAQVRRRLWAGSIVAALMTVVALLILIHFAQRERDRAEGLLTFLLGDEFLGELRDTGRSTLLRQISDRVDKSGGADRNLLNRGLALGNAAYLKRVYGALGESVQLHEEALKVLERAGSDRTTRRAVARAQASLGASYEDQRSV